jgi:HEAT repeat protein
MKYLFYISWAVFASALSGQNNVLDSYTSDENKAAIGSRSKVVLLDFESERPKGATAVTRNIPDIRVDVDGEAKKAGSGLLRVSTVDNADGHHAGSPVFELHLDQSVDFSEYQALSFWLYVPPEKANFFYGRHDVRVQLNDSQLMRTWPAVIAGWNWYVFEFNGLEDLPLVAKLRIRLGPFLEGYDHADLLFDQFELTPMDPPQLDSPSWSARYHGLLNLAREHGLDSLGKVLEACSDESVAVRALAVGIASDVVPLDPQKALPDLARILGHPHWRSRMAGLEIIAGLEGIPDLDPAAIFTAALLDEVYYVRDFGYQQLLKSGKSVAEVAVVLMALGEKTRANKIPALRRISEMGSGAKVALTFLLNQVRDTENSLLVRCWALRAIGEIDETKLIPADWALALSLNPAEVHYHLLNRAMDRLEQASTEAVPVLITSLSSSSPEVRARACVILGSIGPMAAGASGPLQSLLGDNWTVAWEADQALSRILPGHERSVTKPSSISNTSADVEVLESEATTTISNGLVELIFKNGDESPGPYSVRKPGGINLFEADWLESILAFKHSKAPNMIERQWLQRLFGSPFSRNVSTSIHRATPELVDYMILFKGDEVAPIEFEYHFILQRGESGFHTYMITRNVSGKDLIDENFAGQIGVGRFSFLVALTQGAFDYSFLHDKLKGPAAFTEVLAEPIIENYPDIYQSTYRLPSGDVGAKHEWENYELFSPVNGYTSNENGGVWLITPSHEFMDDSMPRFIKRPCYGLLFIPHLQGKYHIKTGARAPADWEKYYGPMYFYLNDGESPEAMWVDAKREAAAQVEQWPYRWLEDEEYHDRGSLTGTLNIADGTSPEGAYVVLANPAEAGDPDQYGVWMRNVGPYSYWTQVEADGTFEIPDIHEGSYEMFAFKPGVYGEVGPEPIAIAVNQQTTVGGLEIKPIRDGQLIWRIGVPDGMAMEFKNGRNYHQWDNYIRYRKDFPKDVDYLVGESDWSQDWNYIHPAIVQGEAKPTAWKIRFDIESIPDAELLLSIMCSGRGAKAKVFLNDFKLGDLAVDIGSHHARTAPVGETVCRKYRISPEQIRVGRNTLEISFAGSDTDSETQFFQSWTSWLCYDFIQLEAVESRP